MTIKKIQNKMNNEKNVFGTAPPMKIVGKMGK